MLKSILRTIYRIILSWIYKVAETKRGGGMGDEMGVDQCRDQCRDRNMK